MESYLFSGTLFLSIFGVGGLNADPDPKHVEKFGKTAGKDFLRTVPHGYRTVRHKIKGM
jgi:hypothetical protein